MPEICGTKSELIKRSPPPNHKAIKSNERFAGKEFIGMKNGEEETEVSE
jgi:hypothetical protein